jgi:hypothetical protein
VISVGNSESYIMVWEYDAEHPKTLYGQIVEKHLGKDAGSAVDTMMDAYKELSAKTFNTAEELRSHFLQGDRPLLDEKQAANIFERTRMKGGSTESVVNDGITSIINIVSGKTVPGPPNPAIQAAIASVQQAIRIVLPFVFILNSLEQSPLFGEMLGAALDITAAFLPVAANSIQATTPALVGLVPIPFAGTIGIGLGWMFSFFFLWLAMVIGISRKDFSSALEATAGMIPVIGATAMKSVASFDRVSTKLANRAERIQQSISSVYGNLQNTLQNTIKATENAVKAAQTKPIMLPPIRPRVGGKRLTRRKKYKNKWKRTRRHRSRML